MYNFWQSVLSQKLNNKIIVLVILITTNPYLLLARRRLDLSRKRELIPSDCYNDLRCNDVYSHRYLSTLRRAGKNNEKYEKFVKTEYQIINNDKFNLAQKQLIKITRR